MNKQKIAEVVERAVKTFIQAYLAVWVAGGPEYDTLFTTFNLQAGVVGVALSLATSALSWNLGQKKGPSAV